MGSEKNTQKIETQDDWHLTRAMQMRQAMKHSCTHIYMHKWANTISQLAIVHCWLLMAVSRYLYFFRLLSFSHFGKRNIFFLLNTFSCLNRRWGVINWEIKWSLKQMISRLKGESVFQMLMASVMEINGNNIRWFKCGFQTEHIMVGPLTPKVYRPSHATGLGEGAEQTRNGGSDLTNMCGMSRERRQHARRYEQSTCEGNDTFEPSS